MTKSIVWIIAATVLILLIPFVAMQFTSEVVWTVSDFIFAGVLLFGTGLVYEYVARKGGSRAYKAATGIAIMSALLLIWINMAAGIIGDDNPANLLYLLVILVGIVGAFIAHFKAEGMAKALFSTAIAQALVPVIALIFWSPASTSWAPGVIGVFTLNTIFVALFAWAGFLFLRANSK